MKLKIFSILVLAGLLSGCLTSKNPLPDSGETQANASLAGYWTRSAELDDGKKTFEVLTVFPSDKVSGHLVLIESIGQVFEPAQADVAQKTEDTDVYDFYVSRVGDQTFVNLHDRSATQREYIIMKYLYDGKDQLQAWNVKDDFLSKAAEKNPEWFGGANSGSSMLDVPEEQGAKFIVSLTEQDYDASVTYTRWTGDLAALKAMVAAGP